LSPPNFSKSRPTLARLAFPTVPSVSSRGIAPPGRSSAPMVARPQGPRSTCKTARQSYLHPPPTSPSKRCPTPTDIITSRVPALQKRSVRPPTGTAAAVHARRRPPTSSRTLEKTINCPAPITREAGHHQSTIQRPSPRRQRPNHETVAAAFAPRTPPRPLQRFDPDRRKASRGDRTANRLPFALRFHERFSSPFLC